MSYNGPVERRVAVRELNQHTSAVLALVASGQAVVVTKGGRPIARLVPAADSGSGVLDDLVTLGRAVAPTGKLPAPAPGVAEGDVAAALVADRADERW